MGKATGIFLIMAGIGTAALILPKVDTDAERQLADVVRRATGSAPRAAPDAATSPVRLKSTASATAEQASVGERGRASRDDRELTVAPIQPVPARREAAVAVPPVLVTSPQPVVRNAAPMHTDDAQARQALARDIQKELKRVGCYDGEISGEWNSATKRAMSNFISRLNAALPSDEPDHILRAMVQGYPGNACGRGTSSAILAQGATKSPRTADQPHVRDAAAARPTVPKPSWETSIAVALPPTTASSPSFSKEGRMAMGGPVPSPASTTVTGSLQAPELRSALPSADIGISVSSAAAGVIPPPAIALPGTIAALSGSVPEQQLGAKSVAQSDDLVAAERRARQRDRERERREAASMAPLPFPQAYRLGAPPVRKYYASEGGYSERGTFTQRFFARQKNGFEAR